MTTHRAVEPTPVDPDLLETLTAVLARSGPTPRDPMTGIPFERSAWDRLDELGLARLTGPEDAGGSGAGWPEAAALLATAAAHAVSLPLAEHDLLATWLLVRAGLPVDAPLRTACVLDASGRATAVPWARDAERVVVLWRADGWRVADVPAAGVTVTPGTNLAGEPRDDVAVALGDLDGTSVDDGVAEELELRGALARAIQVTGALERTVELCVEHVTTRVQFGRPIAAFQAVQALVADAAAETALARATVDVAVHFAASGETTSDDAAGLRLAVATARSCSGHAASLVVRNAHQLHGAIGTTIEHSLHRFTLPALAWRAEFGSVQHWDDVVADAALAAGGEGLWELLTR